MSASDPYWFAGHLDQLIDMAVDNCCWCWLRSASVFTGIVMARVTLLTTLVVPRAVLRWTYRCYTFPSS